MGLVELKNKYKFPEKKPDEIDISCYPKWFDKRHIKFMCHYVGRRTKLIVEIGSWVGHSTRWWFRRCANANIICIDHWKGSAEHEENFSDKQLDKLYHAFVQECWEARERLIPIKNNSISGMLEIVNHGLAEEVEFVYIDGSHQYEDVIADMELAYHAFPNAVLTGDDYTWANPTQNRRMTVQQAVCYFADKHGCEIKLNKGWRFPNLWAIERKKKT